MKRKRMLAGHFINNTYTYYLLVTNENAMSSVITKWRRYNIRAPIHPKLNCAVWLCKKPARKTELNVLWHSTGFPTGLSVFLISSVCLLVRVTMVDKNKAVVWCLLASEETAGFPEWTPQFCVRKTTRKDSSEACAIVCQNCAVYSVFPSGLTSHSKIAQFNWQCIAPLIRCSRW